MREEIIREANPQKTARWHLVFLLLFFPGFLGGSFFLMQRFDVEHGFQTMFLLCGIVVSVLAIWIMLKLLSSKGPQQWKLTEGRLIYSSPTPLLGQSFNVDWNDVVKVYTPDEGDFARCDLADGSQVDFHIGERGGWEFFHTIKKIKAQQQVGAQNS